MIVKATVTTNSAADPEGKGRVKIEAPTIWENSDETDDYYPVNGGMPLNEGDRVFVYIQDMDFANPLILGKCRDNNFTTHGDVPNTFAVLWESVNQGGTRWSVAYTEGDELYIENNSGMVLSVSGGDIQIHNGDNGGLINIAAFNSFVEAVLSDLAILGSGSNVSKWLASDGLKIEDLTVTH